MLKLPKNNAVLEERILGALARLQHDASFQVIVKWLRDEDHRLLIKGSKTLERTESNWRNGASQTLNSLFKLIDESAEKLSELRKGAKR